MCACLCLACVRCGCAWVCRVWPCAWQPPPPPRRLAAGRQSKRARPLPQGLVQDLRLLLLLLLFGGLAHSCNPTPIEQGPLHRAPHPNLQPPYADTCADAGICKAGLYGACFGGLLNVGHARVHGPPSFFFPCRGAARYHRLPVARLALVHPPRVYSAVCLCVRLLCWGLGAWQQRRREARL